MSVVHVKSNTVENFTGTVTVFDSRASTVTIAATDLVRPGDWNSVHNQFYTLTGNTTGNSTASGTNVIVAGSGGISVGGSTGTLVISGPAPVTHPGLHPYNNFVQVVGQVGQGSLILDPQPLPNFMFDQFEIVLQNTNSSNSSGSHTLSFWVGLYTRTSDSLSQHYSASGSTALTQSGTAGSYSLYSGQRLLRLTVNATTITENHYWIGFISSTASAGTDGSYSQNVVSNLASNYTGLFGQASNASMQMRLGQGFYSAATNAMPGSIAFSQIRGTNSLAKRFPVIGFGSGTV
jgi:hypothetical protein